MWQLWVWLHSSGLKNSTPSENLLFDQSHYLSAWKHRGPQLKTLIWTLTCIFCHVNNSMVRMQILLASEWYFRARTSLKAGYDQIIWGLDLGEGIYLDLWRLVWFRGWYIYALEMGGFIEIERWDFSLLTGIIIACLILSIIKHVNG